MQRLGDYNLIERIGAGGMGEVWLAENIHHKKQYALKILPEQLSKDEAFRARFFDEARVMSELDHPNIVRVHHMGEDDGLYYMVMDYVTAPNKRPHSLSDELARGSGHRIAPEKAHRWITQIVQGLAYAHEKGVIHRDIKPGNILINAENQAQITDFGLVKAIGQEFVQEMIHKTLQQQPGYGKADAAGIGAHDVSMFPTFELAQTTQDIDTDHSRRSGGSGNTFGTFDYMSSERLEGEEATKQSDVYSVGVTLYRMLTGRRPVGLAKPPSQVVRGLSKRWDRITQRCMAHSLDERYASAEPLLADLGKVRPGKTRRTWRLVSAALVVVLLALAGLYLYRLYHDPSRGGVIVVSNPDVSVSAAGTDGKAIPCGKTDTQGRLTITALGEGDHALTLSLTDYQSEIVNISVSEGHQLEVKKQLQPLPGRLKLDGRIGLEVYEAGQRLGLANEWIALSAGDHNLELRCRGYRTGRITVTIPPNRPVVEQGVTLVAESGKIKISAESTVPQDNYLADQQAQIRIDNGPWRQVSLPFTEEGLSCDTHRAEVQVSGYESAQAQSTEVADGQTSDVEFRLTPESGTVTISSSVSGAEVFDTSGRKLGSAGEKLTLAPFITHELTVQAPKHKPATVTVKLDQPGPHDETEPVSLEEISGVIRISAESTAAQDGYLAKQRAQIRIDGGPWRPVSLPFTEEGLPCEDHRVELKVSGYENAQSQNTEVREDSTANVTFQLTPEPGTVTISSSVSEAEVVDASGRKLGRAGENLELSPFIAHELTVKAPGHKSATVTVQLDQPGAHAGTESVTLEEIERYGMIRIQAASTSSQDDYLANQQAQIRIDSGSWREVSLPFTEEGLSCETHRVELKVSGYASTQAQNTEVREGSASNVEFRLTPEPGTVTIGSSVSGAEVVDASGRKLGHAGEKLPLAPFITHELTVKAPKHKSTTVTVHLDKPGAHDEARSVTLEEISGNIRINAESTASQDDYLATQQANIRIDGGPWREVSLPFTEEGLSCETHGVELRISGYESAQAQDTEVKEGSTSNVMFQLTPEPGTVTISSSVSGAEVFDASGAKLGRAGESLQLSPFITHQLTVKAPKHKSVAMTVQLDQPGTNAGTKSVTLEEISGPSPGNPWAVPDLGMALAYVAPGSFKMGMKSSLSYADATPIHTVKISQGYWMGKYEVTQGQYESIMRENPSNFKGSDNPVEKVNWNDSVSFCRKLTDQERRAGRLPEGYEYRLPTEAEWEYAGRGGSSSRSTRYAGSNDAKDVAWYSRNSDRKTHPVGRKQANELGLYDMSGNAYEWCLDWYKRYSRESQTDPAGPGTGSSRVIRSGSWTSNDSSCGVAYRGHVPPSRTEPILGFRVVLAPPVRR